MSKYLKRLHFAPAKTWYISLQTGLWFHSHGYELPPHQRACGTTNSGWPAGSRSSSSDNNLRLGRLDSCSNGFRANAAAKRPSPLRDKNQSLKPKRRSHTGVRRPPQSAPAGPHSRPRHKNENGAVPEHERRPHGVRRVMRPPNSRRRSKDQQWGAAPNAAPEPLVPGSQSRGDY
jgi:hypothetical protein